MVSPVDGGYFAPIPGIPPLGQKPETTKAEGPGFAGLLSEMVQNVEKANKEADTAVQGLLTGESADIHSVMLAVNKADLSLRLALEVRNKLVEAYQEIMRMTV